MIVKVERYKNSRNKQNWWLLDNISSITIEEFECEPSKDFSDDEVDVIVLDYEQCLEDNNMKNAYNTNIKLHCAMTDGSDIIIVFDTIAYILNDNGKTIERIVANYKD